MHLQKKKRQQTFPNFHSFQANNTSAVFPDSCRLTAITPGNELLL